MKIDFTFSDTIAGYVTAYDRDEQAFDVRTSDERHLKVHLTPTAYGRFVHNLGEAYGDATTSFDRLLSLEGQFVFAYGTFYPRLADIEQKVGSYTKVVIINSPNNPTGALYSREFIAEIVDFCEKRDLYLIMDDIYHRLLFDGKKPISCWEFAKDKSENSKLVIINGVSKQYAMTGFRIGWAVANKKLIEAMTTIQGHQTSGPSVVLQRAAVGALNGVQSSVESLRITLENNRRVLVERLRSFDGVKIIPPGGTFYSFPDFSAYEKDSIKLAKRLLDKVRVVTVPGKEFGMEGHLRMSFCGSIKDITEGIERIKWVLDPNAPNELYIGDRKLIRDW